MEKRRQGRRVIPGLWWAGLLADEEGCSRRQKGGTGATGPGYSIDDFTASKAYYRTQGDTRHKGGVVEARRRVLTAGGNANWGGNDGTQLQGNLSLGARGRGTGGEFASENPLKISCRWEHAFPGRISYMVVRHVNYKAFSLSCQGGMLGKGAKE